MISLQQEDFDLGAEYQWLRQGGTGDGAIVTFTGLVRDFCQHSTVNSITLEYYPGMTEKSLNKICDEARQRWPLGKIRLIHRIGTIAAAEQIVFVGVTSQHRRAAFAGAEFIMDYLKTQAPFWKKENTPQGALWVEAKDSDLQAAKRW